MMTSQGVFQGYSSQAFIDAKHQVIVHGEAFRNGQDHGHVPTMLTGALANLQSFGNGPAYFKRKILTADSNYLTSGTKYYQEVTERVKSIGLTPFHFCIRLL